MSDTPGVPEGWTLDPAVTEHRPEIGVWWVITDTGLRTAWNEENAVKCPVCQADPAKQPDCEHCSGRGAVDHVPYAERPWDEVIPNLYLGGHHCQMAGAPNGEAIPGDNFDVVVSLYRQMEWDFALHTNVEVERFKPAEGTVHHHHRMADSELDTEHHTRLDDLAQIVVDANAAGKKVLVRCQAGINRSALVVGLAMIRMGWIPDDAIAQMRQARSPYVLFNESFVAHLREAGRVRR